MKYIRTEELGIVIFGNHITHSDMANKLLSGDDRVVSAGFVGFDMVSSENPVRFGGESISLKAKSDPKEDFNYFKMMLRI